MDGGRPRVIPLPEAFAQRMRAALGSGASAYFEAMEQPYVRGIRLHPMKTPDHPIHALIDGIQTRVPWTGDAFALDIHSLAGSHPLHACGAYYLQEPSAMLPARLLDVQPGETVLDLCAAPGGKSTQLAAGMQGMGTLVCNEIVPSRAAALSGNLERMGATNALVVSQNPETLAERWPGLFDRILVDAPCSGEGMFRRHPEARLEWDEGSPARCAKRQLHILQSAAKMLKQGGMLCYSTCTFSQEENEGVISAFRSLHPAFESVDFTVPIGNGQELPSQNGCVRLYPHTVRGEGHFAALLRKTGVQTEESLPVSLLPAAKVFAAPDRLAADAFAAFYAELSPAEPPQANAMIGHLLLSAPLLPPLQGIKAYRAGLSLGRLKGRVFLPDHALALAAPPLPLRTIALDETQTETYLRGEVLPAGAIAGGFWTVSSYGLAPGFVKHSDGQLKNHYPKGLRKPLG
ncbi:MAG: RsmF rRNA methyltransferase first C-terminal domain-containing protein [Firmicutes bacterium]|nr:RsmF rRNA methyltransferase first C-terminal domain-containing protein [Bacillota bacterium]